MRRNLIIFSIIYLLLFWNCTRLYADATTMPAEENNYILKLVVLVRNEKLTVAGESSCRSVEVSIKNDVFEEVVKSTTDVKNDRFEWSDAISKFTSGSIYQVTVTDTEGHTASDAVTIPSAIENIEFEEFVKKLEVGKSLTLNAKVIQSEENQTIKYYSSDNSVAAVSSSGKVTGHKPGKVTITAACGNAREDAELIIYIRTTKIELNETHLTMQPNETFQISTEVFPKTAEQKCTYESTNENVITVNDSGKIIAKKTGVASVLVSNGDALETITVIVNNVPDTKPGESVQTSSNSNVEAENIENSKLAAMIHSSSSKEIAISGKDLSILDASALSILKKENKNLVFDKGTYSILVNGREIVNPAISLMLDIPIEYIDGSIKFVVNEGQPLPGKITIQMRDTNILTKKYLYLYNQIKNKYEKINSFNVDDKSISIDKGGTYLLTEKNIAKFKINWIAVASAVSGCITLLAIYLFTKRRYWFY